MWSPEQARFGKAKLRRGRGDTDMAGVGSAREENEEMDILEEKELMRLKGHEGVIFRC